MRSSVSSRAVIWIVWATPIVSRQNSSRWQFTSRTVTVAPVSLTHSTTDSPIGPAPPTRPCSPVWRPRPAVGVNPEDLQVLAAVAPATPAGEALLTVHVRLDRTVVAGPHVLDPRPDGDDLDPEFVPGDPRVAVERHLAEVTADVGPADADAVDAHQRLAGAWGVRLGDGGDPEPAGFD